MYNLLEIDRELERLSKQTGGVFDLRDLQAILSVGSEGKSRFQRLVSRLVEVEILFRFCRGFYVRRDFDIRLLSRKIDDSSFISLECVLARECVISPTPINFVTALSTRPRRRVFESELGTIRYLSIADSMTGFGIYPAGPLRYAYPERAFLDVLYYYKKGLKLNFNPYTDMDLVRLDQEKIEEYLSHYRNPNFIGFAKGVLNDYRDV